MTKSHVQRTQRAKRAKEGGKSKSAGLCRNKKQGEGKGSPRLERFRVGYTERPAWALVC